VSLTMGQGTGPDPDKSRRIYLHQEPGQSISTAEQLETEERHNASRRAGTVEVCDCSPLCSVRKDLRTG
jgi:hypothetical protein